MSNRTDTKQFMADYGIVAKPRATKSNSPLGEAMRKKSDALRKTVLPSTDAMQELKKGLKK